MRVGITGHQDLAPQCARAVRQRLAEEIEALVPPVIGYSSLAAGADQLFADVVLGCNGQLAVVLPSESYETSFTHASALRQFEGLLRRASETTRLSFSKPSEEAYWRAGQEIVNRSDLLLAVWDGKPAGGLGGTGDVVRYARESGKGVKVIWPAGCARLSA